MTRAICIVGLPGSGKTHLANQMMTCMSGVNLLVDDIQDFNQLPESGVYDHVIITDPNFCATKVRELAQTSLAQTYGDVRWIFFENDPAKCRCLVEHRADGRKVNEFITNLSAVYEIPPDADVRPIWQPVDDNDTLVFLRKCLAFWKLTGTLPSTAFDERITVAQLKSQEVDQLYNLGFGNWDDESILLPRWTLGLIKHREILVSINGNTAVVGQDYIDDDTRGGVIAWGFQRCQPQG